MKMKSLKAQFIGAIAMVLVAAIAMGSSTYAWFAMNTSVSATNMNVKAVAEDGIVISNSAKSDWSNTANAQVTTASLFPTSTSTVLTGDTTKVPSWAHATSTNPAQAQADQDAGNYADLSLLWSSNQAGGEGVGYIEVGSNTSYDSGTDAAYVLLNNFYIKASGSSLSGQTLYINDVSVSNASHKIDNALRVLIVVNNVGYIYAPVSGADSGTATFSYNFKKTTPVVAKPASEHNVAAATNLTIPNTNDGAINVRVYVYFEGEDANCMSNNISTITTANLAVTVNFGTAEKTYPASNGNG